MPNLTATMTGNWLIDPYVASIIRMNVESGVSGDAPRMWTAANREAVKLPKAVAVLPLTGIMEPRASEYTYYFGGTSTEDYGQAFDRAMSDPAVKAVILDVYSPGGMVYGTPELARKIFNARGSKPIVAIANPMAASAALWAGTAADRFYITPSGEAGSHGVYQMHMDYSKAMEEDGIKATFISAGKYKVEGNPYEPASQEFLDNAQADVEETMGEFTSALARHRGKSSSYVMENFGQGRLLSAKKAVEVGLADGVMAFEQVVSRLLSGHIRTGQAASADDLTTPVQDEFHERRFGNVGDLQRKLAIARR